MKLTIDVLSLVGTQIQQVVGIETATKVHVEFATLEDPVLDDHVTTYD